MTNSIDSVAGVDDFATMVKDLMAERDKLQADLAAARADNVLLVRNLRGFNGVNGATYEHLVQRAERAEADLAAAQALLHEIRNEREDALHKMQDDLAAARALLREAITHVNCHAFSSADRLAERIDAALDGEGKT